MAQVKIRGAMSIPDGEAVSVPVSLAAFGVPLAGERVSLRAGEEAVVDRDAAAEAIRRGLPVEIVGLA